MGAAIRFVLAYWFGIFALGFLLGTVRVLLLAPHLGELAAVLAELPVMLGTSWLWARRLLARNPLGPGKALFAGALAFCLLTGSEAALALLAFGQRPGDWLGSMAMPAGALGLAGQVAFGALPWLAARKG